MADNYLEKKWEEHARGPIRQPMRHTPSGNKAHTATMPCVLRGAFVIGGCTLSPLLRACAIALRDTSCRTAFCCTDRAEGAKTAQAYGLQYYPVAGNDYNSISEAIAMARNAYGAIDVTVKETSGSLWVDIYGNISEIKAEDDCPVEVFAKVASQTIVYLALPQSRDLQLCGRFTVNKDGRLSIVKD